MSGTVIVSAAEYEGLRERIAELEGMLRDAGVDLSEAQARVAELEAESARLREQIAIAFNTCRDVTELGRFSPTVNPVRWVEQLQKHLEAEQEGGSANLATISTKLAEQEGK